MGGVSLTEETKALMLVDYRRGASLRDLAIKYNCGKATAAAAMGPHKRRCGEHPQDKAFAPLSVPVKARSTAPTTPKVRVLDTIAWSDIRTCYCEQEIFLAYKAHYFSSAEAGQSYRTNRMTQADRVQEAKFENRQLPAVPVSFSNFWSMAL